MKHLTKKQKLEQVQAENKELRKRPYNKQVLGISEFYPVESDSDLQSQYIFERMKNEIDRLTAEIATLEEKLGVESYHFREQKQVNKELQVELKDKDDRIKELQEYIRTISKSESELGEFTKDLRNIVDEEGIDDPLINITPEKILQACDIIDRLIAELKTKDVEIASVTAENIKLKLKEALSDCIIAQNTGSFPEKQCAANRGRILLEALKGV